MNQEDQSAEVRHIVTEIYRHVATHKHTLNVGVHTLADADVCRFVARIETLVFQFAANYIWFFSALI